jgi:hypothetical protein
VTTKRAMLPAATVPLAQVKGVPLELRKVQQNVEKATKEARAMPQTKGRKITVHMPASGRETVNHKLGRKPEGYNVTRITGTASPNFWEVNSNKRTIVFESTAQCLVELWVY